MSMAKHNDPRRRTRPRAGRPRRRDLCLSLFATALLTVSVARCQEVHGNRSRDDGRCRAPGGGCDLPPLTTADGLPGGGSAVDDPAAPRNAAAADDGGVDHGNHHREWEDGPSSWEEFGHDNDPRVCGVERLTVAEWEAGRYWKGNRPVIVTNATAGWAALHRWKKQEMVRLYADAEATMGDGRRVGETGPDGAGNILTPTTVKEFITKYMYHPFKYFFDRKIAIPNGMLEDCHPFPMPTRRFLQDPTWNAIRAPAKKEEVVPIAPMLRWQDHLAISIGADRQGLSLHYHMEAWNVVLFGKKRWILWPHRRFRTNTTRQRDFALGNGDDILSGAEWIRQLYPRQREELRAHGHDCVQHAGELMFVPQKWMHLVVNIGDTVSVISEVGLEKGEGKKPEDFEFDPTRREKEEEESSDDYLVESSDDYVLESSDDGSEDRWRSYDSSGDSDDEDWSSDDGPPPQGWGYRY